MTQPMELLSKLAGFGFGYLLADGVDRYAATHALTTDATGNVTDTPAAGQIYDSEAVSLPIWSSPMRMGMNAAAIALPFLLSKYFAKEFMLHAGIAAVVRTVGKAATDAVAQYAPTNATTLQLYGDRVAANARLAQATNGLTSAAAGTFAGVPRRRQMAAAPAPKRLAARRIGDDGTSTDCPTESALITDPLAQAMAQTDQWLPSASKCGCDNGFNPMTAGVIDIPTSGDGSSTWFLNYPPLPPMATTPSPGTQTLTTTTTCTQSQVQALTGQLAGLMSQIDNPYTSPLASQYNSIYAQLVACGVSPSQPSLATLQANYTKAQSMSGTTPTTTTSSGISTSTPR
jgi:hypothetical protein